jgi:hypothetical protein
MQFQQPTNATLDFGTQQVNPNALYLVDFTKLNNVNDLVLILSAMGISFAGNHPHFSMVKPFLNLDKPMFMNQQPEQPMAEVKPFKFPEIKKVK